MVNSRFGEGLTGYFMYYKHSPSFKDPRFNWSIIVNFDMRGRRKRRRGMVIKQGAMTLTFCWDVDWHHTEKQHLERLKQGRNTFPTTR